MRVAVKIYSYVENSSLDSADPQGLMGSGGGGTAGRPKYVWKKTEPPGGFAGWEAQMGYGVGRTAFTCTDECGKKRTFIYKKVCTGASLGLGAGAGMVQGVNGSKCRSGNYAGWFAEGGIAAGPVSGNVDVGFNEDGPSIPGLQTIFGANRLPGSVSGVYEGGIGAGSHVQSPPFQPFAMFWTSSWSKLKSNGEMLCRLSRTHMSQATFCWLQNSIMSEDAPILLRRR